MLDLEYLKAVVAHKDTDVSCVQIAEALGIDCKEKNCRECNRKKAETLEKIIKNACIMYDIHGDMINFGDYVVYEEEVYMVRCANGFEGNNRAEILLSNFEFLEYVEIEKLGDYAELFEVTKASDGKEIKIGDIVYCNGKTYTVVKYSASGDEVIARSKENIFDYSKLSICSITHEIPEPDSIEKIKADAIALYTDYFGCSSPDRSMCGKCPALIDGKKPYDYYGTFSCIQAKDLDIIRRVQEVCSRV